MQRKTPHFFKLTVVTHMEAARAAMMMTGGQHGGDGGGGGAMMMRVQQGAGGGGGGAPMMMHGTPRLIEAAGNRGRGVQTNFTDSLQRYMYMTERAMVFRHSQQGTAPTAPKGVGSNANLGPSRTRKQAGYQRHKKRKRDSRYRGSPGSGVHYS
eukprot:COSAG02_NODE_13237_length_1421_cov_3.006051_2_plen_154_part_00